MFVFPVRRAAVILCGLVLLHVPSRAAILIHEYALRGSLEDNLGGDSLGNLGGQITALGYVFAANQGLTFSARDFTPANYSIELSFKFDMTTGPRKIIDFHNLTADPGVYQQNGVVGFSPVVNASVADIVPGTNVHLVLTLDGATNIVTAYVNGQQRFSFYDTQSLAAPPGFSNKLSFFADEMANSQASGGMANYVRIFNGALTANEVGALYVGGAPISVPEPSTCMLIALGALVFAFGSRQRSRRP